MIQEYAAMSSWGSINRILFVSNKLPVRREFYPVVNASGVFSESFVSYENLVSMNIICSFVFASTHAGDYRTNLSYATATVDSSDLIDMPSTTPIREIDIEVFWSDKYGNVFPITLGVNKQVNVTTIKRQFERLRSAERSNCLFIVVNTKLFSTFDIFIFYLFGTKILFYLQHDFFIYLAGNIFFTLGSKYFCCLLFENWRNIF